MSSQPAAKMDLRVQSLFGQLSLLSLELTTSCTSSSNNSDCNKSTEPLGQHSCRGTKPEAAAENSIFPTHISCSWASHQPGGAADLSSLCSAQKKCQIAKRKNKINLLEVIFPHHLFTYLSLETDLVSDVSFSAGLQL